MGKNFIFLIILIQFFTPSYTFFDGYSPINFILPYFKHKLIFFLSVLYYLLNPKKLFFWEKSKYRYYLIFFLISYLSYTLLFVFQFDNFIHKNQFSLSSILFCFLILSEKTNLIASVNKFNHVLKYFIVIIFIELLSTFFIDNPYSFSTYSKSFVSIFLLDLNLVSITANLVFSIALYNIIVLKKSINLNLILLAICFLICFYTYNRTSIIINFLLIFLILFLTKKFTRLVLSTFIIFIIINFLTYFESGILFNTATKSYDNLASFYIRISLLIAGFYVLIDNFFLGIGPFLIDNQMSLTIPNIESSTFYYFIGISENITLMSGRWITNPHFAFLNLILNFGIVGLFFYLSIFKDLKSMLNKLWSNHQLILTFLLLSVIFMHNFMYPQIRLEHLFFFFISMKMINEKYILK